MGSHRLLENAATPNVAQSFSKAAVLLRFCSSAVCFTGVVTLRWLSVPFQGKYAEKNHHINGDRRYGRKLRP